MLINNNIEILYNFLNDVITSIPIKFKELENAYKEQREMIKTQDINGEDRHHPLMGGLFPEKRSHIEKQGGIL